MRLINHLIIVLVLTFGLQSFAKAEDISEFEIEGMSVGDSLLKYLSKEEIENKISKPTTFKYKNEKYVQIGTYKKSFETYDTVGVTIKPNDEDFIIYVLAGQFNFGDDIEGCNRGVAFLQASSGRDNPQGRDPACSTYSRLRNTDPDGGR